MTGFTAVECGPLSYYIAVLYRHVYMYTYIMYLLPSKYAVRNIALMTPEKWLLLDFLEIVVELNRCADSHITFGFVVVI